MPAPSAISPVDLFKQFQSLLREGKTQEVDDAITRAIAAAPAEAGGLAGGAALPPAPRPAETIMQDLLRAIVTHLGNHPTLLKLVEELFPAAAE